MSPKTDAGVDASAGTGPFPIGTGSVAPGRGDNTREVSDEELVQRMREGEAAAAETLCRRYHQALFRYLQRIGGSEHVAEELHQQTWVSVLEHLDRFDPASSPGGFKAWLFRIATNKGNDLWRSRGREKATKESFRQIVDQTSPEASAPMEGDEQVERLRREIERLPEPQRKVLMLRYYSGMKFVEIAQILGCPLNTALGRMHKAILKLRSAMES